MLGARIGKGLNGSRGTAPPRCTLTHSSAYAMAWPLDRIERDRCCETGVPVLIAIFEIGVEARIEMIPNIGRLNTACAVDMRRRKFVQQSLLSLLQNASRTLIGGQAV